jgi:hypothetical protein
MVSSNDSLLHHRVFALVPQRLLVVLFDLLPRLSHATLHLDDLPHKTAQLLGVRAFEELDVGAERKLGQDAIVLAVLLFLERLLQREPLVVEEWNDVDVDVDHAGDECEVGG